MLVCTQIYTLRMTQGACKSCSHSFPVLKSSCIIILTSQSREQVANMASVWGTPVTIYIVTKQLLTKCAKIDYYIYIPQIRKICICTYTDWGGGELSIM